MEKTKIMKRILAYLLVFAMIMPAMMLNGTGQAQAAMAPIAIAVGTSCTLTDFTGTLGDDDANTMFLATTQYNNYAPIDNPTDPDRKLQNNAAVVSGMMQLTDNSNWKVGTIVRRSPIKLNGGFSTYFKFDINNAPGATADGLSFILYDAGGGVKMGAPGGCLGLNDLNIYKYTSTGYSGGTLLPQFDNSIAVEFDTYRNTGVDPQQDNFSQAVAIDVDGSSAHTSGLANATTSSAIDDGTSAVDHEFTSLYDTTGSTPMHVWIEYVENTTDPELYPGNTGTVTVTYGLSSTRSDAGNRTIVRHVSDELLYSDVYVGFTASTGGAGEFHQILGWKFRNAPGGLTSTAPYTQAASGITIDTRDASASTTTNPTHVVLQLKDGVGSDLTSAQNISISIDAGTSSEITTSAITTASGTYDYTLPSLSPGSHTITAATTDGSAQSAKTFTVNTPLTSVTISGTAQVGQTLSAVVAPSGATVSYQWYSGGSAVSTAASYTPASTDEGNTITVEATGTGYYTGTVTSAATAAVIPESSGSHRSSGGSKDSTSQPIAEVNGQPTVSGTSSEATSGDGKTTTNIVVNQTSLENQLKDKAAGATVTIPFTKPTDIAVGELNGQMVKDMEGKEATLVIETPTASYTLPAEQINIDSMSETFGSDLDLSDIKVKITIADPTDTTVQVVQQAASKGDLTLVVPAVDFEVSCTYNGRTVNVSRFNAFVERRVAIPEGADPQKITTAVVVDPDGKTRHVPTKVVLENGVYYAVINSLTNSTYSVVWHPFEFSDVTNSWARESINNMGSRMVVSGVDGSNYEPNRNMTRSEFAAIVVKALGLVPGDGSMTFNDVAASEWYSDYVKTAASYGVISGYGDGNFGPNDTITREQAMTMIARAMSLTSLKETVNDAAVLAKFTDSAEISAYATSSIAKCVTVGVVGGKTETTVVPKAEITRAEVAAIVERMLKKADLID